MEHECHSKSVFLPLLIYRVLSLVREEKALFSLTCHRTVVSILVLVYYNMSSNYPCALLFDVYLLVE